jgi:four helix bundle protein
MKNFRELEIWKFGFRIGVNACSIVESLPKEFKWALGQQVIKSGISISSNIAEGASRTSQKDFNRFIEISLGSSYELETQLMVAKAANIGDITLIDQTLTLLISEEKMLTVFSQHLQGKR